MFRQWLALVIIVLVYIPVAIDATVLHVAAPTLSMTLGASGNELLWIIDIYSLVMAGMVLPMGALGDRIGFKRLLMIGSTLFGLSSLAAAFGSTAESRGLEVVIAAAGGAAHLAGVLAAHTTLPVLGVPMRSEALNGMDSLLATVQMPAGIPVGTLAIGKPGATNAALLAIAILANSRPELKKRLRLFRAEQEKKIREITLD